MTDPKPRKTATGTKPYLRAVGLAVLVGFLVWWSLGRQWGHAAIDGVLVVALLVQWINERSNR